MKDEIIQAIARACHELFGVDVTPELTRTQEQFGDYATNVALQLSKQVGKNPREIAELIRTHLSSLQGETLQKIEVAGAGFLNITLSDEALHQMAEQAPGASLQAQKVLVEYSDPNPFKPLHAGHLYTTLVGDTIARLVERAGAETVRLNYGGDVGLHVGKSMWAIIRTLGGENADKLSDVPVAERPAWLGERYVEGNNAYEDDESAKAEIVEVNKRVYQLHASGDQTSAFAHIYYTTRQWSYDYFKVLYDQLQVRPFDRYVPESEVTPLGLTTVREQQQKGVFTESDGAVVFAGEQFDLHTRVFINSEGLPTYETKDVGLSLIKWQDYHFDQSIIITANEQAQYMQVVIAAIKQFAPEPAERTRHLTHGVVKLQGGVKMSSRKGNVVTALEILDAARAAGQETGTNPSEETILAAVKYAFARARIGGDIVYDPKESIALEGNSGPYIQYAHARARSILAKATVPRTGGERSEPGEGGLSPSEAIEAPEKGEESRRLSARRPAEQAMLADAQSRGRGTWRAPSKQEVNGLQPAERSLLRKIAEYPEVVEKATNELMPHHVCTYLYELAQTFNSFYEHNRVIGSGEREAPRLDLVRRYADTLRDGLDLLGIAAPDHM